MTATALVATVTVRMIREEGHKMARQNEIVWKKDLTDIQSGLETLATKTKISIDLSSMNYDKVKKINVVALEIAVNKL